MCVRSTPVGDGFCNENTASVQQKPLNHSEMQMYLSLKKFVLSYTLLSHRINRITLFLFSIGYFQGKLLEDTGQKQLQLWFKLQSYSVLWLHTLDLKSKTDSEQGFGLMVYMADSCDALSVGVEVLGNLLKSAWQGVWNSAKASYSYFHLCYSTVYKTKFIKIIVGFILIMYLQTVEVSEISNAFFYHSKILLISSDSSWTPPPL